MDGALIGRIVLYFALAWTLYVGSKAVYESVQHWQHKFLGDATGNPVRHRKLHIIYMLLAATVCFMQLAGYLWFDLKETGLEGDDRTIGIFNILVINIYMLMSINHYKHERLNRLEKGTWKEILKF